MKFLNKNRTLKIGALTTLIYLIICYSGNKISDILFILMLYLPGFFFGIGVSISLKTQLKEKSGVFLITLLSFAFILTLLFVSKNYVELIEVRRQTAGGIGALISIFLIQINTKLKFNTLDFFLALVIGVISTYRDPFTLGIGINDLLITIAIWQIGMFYIINRRYEIMCFNNKNLKDDI